AAAQSAFILVGDCVKKGERHILADHRSGLKQVFVLGGQPVDAGGDNRLRGGGDLRGVHGARQTIRAALSGASTQWRSSKTSRSGWMRLSASSRRFTASSVRCRRSRGSLACHSGSSTSTSKSARRAGREGSRARSSVMSFPVIFSRTWRWSSRSPILKYVLSRSTTGRYGVVRP